MKKVFVLFSIITILVLSTGCTPTAEPVADEPETPGPVTQPKEDPEKISALRIPFDITELDNYNAPLEFSDGDWEIVDINEVNNCIFKITSKVSHDNGNYNCSSMTLKIDLPKGSETEETIDYEEFYSQFMDNCLPSFTSSCTFSKGFLTENTIVLIAQFDTQLFNQLYLPQLPGISNSKVLSNYAKTKYMIDKSTDSYQETIFIYKLGNKASSSEFADCTVSCSSSDFDLSEGDWLDRKVQNQPNGKVESFYVLSVTADGKITKDLNYSILLMDLQAKSQLPGMSETMSDQELLSDIKLSYSSSSDPDSSYISVLVDEKNIICAFQASADTTTYAISEFFLLNNASSIKTNSSKTKYIVTGSFENMSGETITETLYLHKVN